MIVVADTSPIISLSAIGQFELLRRLYGEVRVPTAVFEEVASAEDVLPGSVEVRQAKWLIEQPLSPRSAKLAKPAPCSSTSAKAKLKRSHLQ